VLLREVIGTVEAEVVARPAVTNIMSPLDAALAAAFHGFEVRESMRAQAEQARPAPSATLSGVRSVRSGTLVGMAPVAAQPSRPAAQQSAAQRPAEQQSAAQQSAVQKPAAQRPTEQRPAEQQSAAQQSAAQQPAVQQPAVQQPAVQQPAVQQPAVQQPAVQRPAEQRPAVQKSAAQRAAEQKPAPQQQPSPKPALGKEAVLALHAMAPPPDNDQGLFGRVTPSAPPASRPGSLFSAEVLPEGIGPTATGSADQSNALTVVASPTHASAPTMASLPAVSTRASLFPAPARATPPAAAARASLASAPTIASLPAAPAEASPPAAPTETSLPAALAEASLPAAPAEASLPAALPEASLPAAPAEATHAPAPSMASLATDPTMESLATAPVRTGVAMDAARASLAAAVSSASELNRAFGLARAELVSGPRARQLLRHAKPLTGAAVAILVVLGLLAVSAAPKQAERGSAKVAASAAAAMASGLATPTATTEPTAWASVPLVVLPAAVADAQQGESADSLSDEPAVTGSPAYRAARAKALVLRGNLLLRQGQTAKAKSSYQAALKFVPSETRALTALTQLALKERNAAAALPYARAFARLKPKSKVALVLLGDAQRLSGDLTSARATWQKAARLGAKDARQRLRDSAK